MGAPGLSDGPLLHASCGQALLTRAGSAGVTELWCPLCRCAVAHVALCDRAAEDEASGDTVVRYLASRYDVGLLDAMGVVRRHLPTLFDGIDHHRSTAHVGDELAALAKLRVRGPHSDN